MQGGNSRSTRNQAGELGESSDGFARSFILTFRFEYSLPLGVLVNRFQTNQLEFLYARRRLHLHLVAFSPAE